MQDTQIDNAASLLWQTWISNQQLEQLPAECRPASIDEGYAIQARIAARSGQSLFGWKIAATSKAGQAHIGVDGPIAGRLLSGRVFEDKARVPFDGNEMKVAEAEFAFRFARALPPRATPWTQQEVLDAVASLHPAIEVPNSRYRDFVRVGAPQLIADNACAHYFVRGPATREDWRAIDLAAYGVIGEVEGKLRREGKGANVLGDPRIALTWLVNELSRLGVGIGAGQTVTTGTCVVPLEVDKGDHVIADFGRLGRAEAWLT